MKYEEANKIAEGCSLYKDLICTDRCKYRDCDRPLCCGFCPVVDSCESVCSIIEGDEDDREGMGKRDDART